LALELTVQGIEAGYKAVRALHGLSLNHQRARDGTPCSAPTATARARCEVRDGA
jgi:hypothetical protein